MAWRWIVKPSWRDVDVDALARRRSLWTHLTHEPEDECPRCGGDREDHRGRPCPDCQGDDR